MSICCPGFFWVDLFVVHNFFFGMLPWVFKLGNIYNIELELVHLMVMTSPTALAIQNGLQ